MLAGHIVAHRQIELIDVPEPELNGPGPDGDPQIIFEPHYTCLCGSDLPFFDGDFNGEPTEFPQQVGHSLHEMIGRVVDTNGEKFSKGERVLTVPVYQVGFFERFCNSENRTIHVDDRPHVENALMAQPLGTVMYALAKLPSVMDLDVVVVGQGPIGQLFNATLRNLGAREIIGIDKLQSRLETSPKMGATATICNATEDPVSAVQKILGGKLPDLVIEAVGHKDQTLNLCIDLTRKFGTILFFGVPPEQIHNVNMLKMWRNNLKLVTSVEPGFERDFPLAMRWIAEGRIDVSPIITHRYPLEKIQEAYEVFLNRTDGALKVMVEFPAAGNS
ncbi:D-arabitol-phosphate dehydrogenase [Symmachiella dynata]|uniref:zinc-dependent alcohol dehydrogenase n=1 Tax=Symmachiella dynata TaxID=2527995 RepID=UPI0011878BB0|nr:zinc-binding dehydrogenase [Symmachiella dynata]QDT49882.1 D-arabitol-phosphate dehydrogenase [Symmachiella dynata]